MGINSETENEADLQIGPTSSGMVRIYIAANGFDLPMDFVPQAAREIAEELIAAASIADNLGQIPKKDSKMRKSHQKKPG